MTIPPVWRSLDDFVGAWQLTEMVQALLDPAPVPWPGQLPRKLGELPRQSAGELALASDGGLSQDLIGRWRSGTTRAPHRENIVLFLRHSAHLQFARASGDPELKAWADVMGSHLLLLAKPTPD